MEFPHFNILYIYIYIYIFFFFYREIVSQFPMAMLFFVCFFTLIPKNSVRHEKGITP